MTDGDDVYDINPLKTTSMSSEEGQQSYHLIRKTSFAEVVQRAGLRHDIDEAALPFQEVL